MKRTKTKLLRTLFVIALIMYGITFNEEVNARTITEDETNQICTEITQKIENKSKSVIENDFSNIKKITTYYSEEVGINSEELKNIAVGKPFMIYSLSDSKQLEGIEQPDSGVLILKDCDMYGLKLQQWLKEWIQYSKSKTKNLKGQTIMLKITTKIMERQKVSNIILKRWRT